MKIVDLVKDYKNLDGQKVEFNGWLRNHRTGKNISFMMINDGTAFDTIQVVYKDLSNMEELNKTNIGAAVAVSGIVKITENGKQDFEVVAENIEILGASEEDYPMQPKKHSYEFLREKAHFRARTNTFNAVFRIRSLLAFAIHDFFNQNDFVYVNTPIITGADAEGAGEMFKVTTLDFDNLPTNDNGEVDYKQDFFGDSVNLTVSGQLLGESYALAFSNIYTFGPTFRAENSNTTRHASEFWMVEPEMAYCDLEGDIKVARDMLIYVVKYVLNKAPKELAFLNSLVDYDLVGRLENLVAGDFQEIDYKDAIEILEKAVAEGHKFENKVEFGIDLATEHEKFLTDEHFHAPVFVKNYPKDIKAFYMKQNDDGITVAAMDLLVPGIGELIGGSERETRLDVLEEVMAKHNLDGEEYKWYLELRKYGGVTHSGFGIGFERLVMYVTGMENIRDVLPFPRTPNNCNF